ncbi:hypothetical protein LAZ67_6000060 [Cordylochernes scorpioides]|uniref:Mariner Mos1 transposase n=1 Tax=Cordylochernes scorpioides TaxID=51811 RepID=A0ABY6KI86_9ARAC|nr:hypothetical protein LAZ67_6000060 [Cordylochernes scorpioides]
MDLKSEQRVCICQKLGKTAPETFQGGIGVRVGSLITIKRFKWFVRFKSGRESTQVDTRQGRPSLENHEELTQKIKILTEDLGLEKKFSKFVPKILLHHDYVPAHRALSVGDFLTKNSMLTMPHPPYSPDLAPNDFFLFPRMNLTNKYENIELNLIKARSQERNVLRPCEVRAARGTAATAGPTPAWSPPAPYSYRYRSEVLLRTACTPSGPPFVPERTWDQNTNDISHGQHMAALTCPGRTPAGPSSTCSTGEGNPVGP